ncbi:MAG: TatD family hydrolase [Ferruginibacter sp.]
MKIVDAHTHTEFRSANDYWYMSMAGVSTIIDPATFGGYEKKTPDVYYHYYERLLNFETWRAKKNGIDLFVGVGVDPEDFTDVDVALEVIENIPGKYFGHEKCCCLGEIGLDKGTADEEKVFRKQLEIVGKYKIPAIIHTPQVQQTERIEQIVSTVNTYLDEYPHIKEYLLLDEIIPVNLPRVIDTGFAFYGVPASPVLDSPFVVHRKAPWNEIYELVKEFGSDKIILNSALAWGYGDGLSLSKIRLSLLQNGVDEKILDRLFYYNASSFFNKFKKIIPE